MLADLAPRLVSYAVSKADAERVVSTQQNITGLHRTRFRIMTVEKRLKNPRLLRITEPDQEEVVLAGTDCRA
jgi:uncharacterized heparinase superfamily protein